MPTAHFADAVVGLEVVVNLIEVEDPSFGV